MWTEKNQKNLACSLLAGGWLIMNCYFLLCHEPWRDEAQTWLLARDLPFWKLPAQMSYEGHPCLWHMLIWPLVHMGLHYRMQNILAFVIMSIAVFLFIYRARLPLLIKAAAVFSPMLTYYYPVIARNYCLIPLFLFLAALWYPARFEHPWRYTLTAALLVQSHVIMVITAFSLSFCFFCECSIRFYRDRQRREYGNCIAALSLPLGSAVFLLYELLNVERSSLLHIDTASVRRTLEKMMESTVEGTDMLCGISGLSGVALFLLGLVLLLYLLLRSRTKAKYTAAVTLVLTWGFQFWFYAMAYSFSMQRLLTFPLLMIWAMWIVKTEEADDGESTLPVQKVSVPQLFFAVFCLAALYHTIPDIKMDILGPYSNGKEAAAFIQEKVPPQAIILTDNQAEVSAIFPYLDRKDFIYAPNMHYYTFVTWDEHWMDRTDFDTFQRWLAQAEIGQRPVYLISSSNHSYIDGSERFAQEYSLLYESATASIKEEDYRIYRIQ